MKKIMLNIFAVHFLKEYHELLYTINTFSKQYYYICNIVRLVNLKNYNNPAFSTNIFSDHISYK